MEESVRDFLVMDKRKISWSDELYQKAMRLLTYEFDEHKIVTSLYRPFVKENLYFDRDFNKRVFLIPSMFPTSDSQNLIIDISGVGSKRDFSVLMTSCVPDYSVESTSQCFPLYWYEEDTTKTQGLLFEEQKPEDRYVRQDGVSDKALDLFRNRYRDYSITKEDIFYYIYGVLSSPEYKERFGDDVKKTLARVPFVKDFRTFCDAGRKLGNLHVNYESVEPMNGLKIKGLEDTRTLSLFSTNQAAQEGYYRIEKMRIIEQNGSKAIRYNENITIGEIPTEAWDYIVNGKSALEWIIERYQDSIDKDSGLRNDCNAWGIEHGNPQYVLDLIRRVVRVSVESVRIIKSLPELGID